jgi:hypothetical protein
MQRDIVVVILYSNICTSMIPSGIVPANFRVVAPCPAENFIADTHKRHFLLKYIFLSVLWDLWVLNLKCKWMALLCMKCHFCVSAYEKAPVTKVRKLGKLLRNILQTTKLATNVLVVYPDYLRIY